MKLYDKKVSNVSIILKARYTLFFVFLQRLIEILLFIIIIKFTKKRIKDKIKVQI